MTGIEGLDEITGGGLPQGRPTLVCGSAGCGKTLLAMHFLANGANQFDEPGVFMSFEERPGDLTANVRSLQLNLDELIRRKRVLVDYVHVDRGEIDETGEYNLEGLFIRLGHAIDSVGARRVVLDTVENLFAALANHGVLRSELRRLFTWLKDRGVTAVVTCERGDGVLTRHGIEEYVSDCVILLDHRVENQISTRRLRVVKYRGTAHGADEYPFLINETGIRVLPITSVGLEHQVSVEKLSSGIPRLDSMLGGEGFYRGSTILISGTAGTGKSSLAAHFTASVCANGGRCAYFAFEESPAQIIRNMKSIGVDLETPWKAGRLRFQASRPTSYGLESHLAGIHRLVTEFEPTAVILDPITNLTEGGTRWAAHAMLVRVIDVLKSRGITALFTSLTAGGSHWEATDVGVSSLVDAWLLLRDIETNGERNRGLYVLKARGLAHSNQIREFVVTSQGVNLLDVYVGAEGHLTGSSRVNQEARERAAALARQQAVEQRKRELDRKRRTLEARIAALQAEFAPEEQELTQLIAQDTAAEAELDLSRASVARSRRADGAYGAQNGAAGRPRPRSKR